MRIKMGVSLFIFGVILLLGTITLISAPFPAPGDLEFVVVPGFDGLVSVDNVVLKISSDTNAHGELWNGTAYSVNIAYTIPGGGDVDGLPFIYQQSTRNCTPTNNPTNTVLRLSAITNAHAQSPSLITYPIRVCYGDLNCTYRTSCEGNEQCVVTLSSDTNAHLAKCNISGSYSNKICCAPRVKACEEYGTKSQCWGTSSQNCTWTPPVNSTTGRPTTSNSDGGGCCASTKRWVDGACEESFITLCTIPWTQTLALELKTRTITKKQFEENYYTPVGAVYKFNGQHKYCAMINKGMNTGIWESVNKY